MTILFTSDLHSNEEAYHRYSRVLRTSEMNIGVIAGDLYHYVSNRAERAYLLSILDSVKKHIFVVFGNHDDHTGLRPKWVKSIVNRRVNIGKYNLVGFNPRDCDKGMVSLADIQSLVDNRTVLVTHYPAYGVLDGDDIHIGDEKISRLVTSAAPLFHLFGHVHERFGIYNRSINGAYPRSHKFFEINIDTAKIEMV